MPSFNLDLRNETTESVDAFGKVPDGWYHLVLVNVEEDDEKAALVFLFEISEGPFKGSKLRDWLHDPDFAEKNPEFHRRKASMYASRLELLSADDMGKEVEIEYENAVGKEVVAYIATRNDYNEIKMGQVYPSLDHPKCPAEAKHTLRGDPLPEKTSRSKSSSKPEQKTTADPLAGI